MRGHAAIFSNYGNRVSAAHQQIASASESQFGQMGKKPTSGKTREQPRGMIRRDPDGARHLHTSNIAMQLIFHPTAHGQPSTPGTIARLRRSLEITDNLDDRRCRQRTTNGNRIDGGTISVVDGEHGNEQRIQDRRWRVDAMVPMRRRTERSAMHAPWTMGEAQESIAIHHRTHRECRRSSSHEPGSRKRDQQIALTQIEDSFTPPPSEPHASGAGEDNLQTWLRRQ